MKIGTRRLLASTASAAIVAAAATVSPVLPTPAAHAVESTNQTAFTFLVSEGFTEAQAAGILGNLMAESGNPINPRAGTTYHGIVQWGGARWTNLVYWARQTGRDPWALRTQLEWMMREFAGAENRAWQKIKATSTPADAARATLVYYERGSTASLTKRINYANSIMATLGSVRNGDTTYPTLYAGKTGSSVLSLQLLLKHRGYITPATGSFTATTARHLSYYERASRLVINGRADSGDWDRLTPNAGYLTRGEGIRALQLELNQEKILPNLTVTAVYDVATAKYVRAYQSRAGLPVTGVADELTWRALID